MLTNEDSAIFAQLRFERLVGTSARSDARDYARMVTWFMDRAEAKITAAESAMTDVAEFDTDECRL